MKEVNNIGTVNPPRSITELSVIKPVKVDSRRAIAEIQKLERSFKSSSKTSVLKDAVSVKNLTPTEKSQIESSLSAGKQNQWTSLPQIEDLQAPALQLQDILSEKQSSNIYGDNADLKSNRSNDDASGEYRKNHKRARRSKTTKLKA